MPWKELDLVEQRFRFIEEWRSEDYSLAELCRHYEITRATGYKWVRRYEAGGLESLGDRSRAPHHHPNELPEEMEELVLSLRSGHPSWGAPKIRAKIRQDHAALSLPAESTIGAILQRNDLTLPRESAAPGARRPARWSSPPGPIMSGAPISKAGFMPATAPASIRSPLPTTTAGTCSGARV